jgi:hypothetical protein
LVSVQGGKQQRIATDESALLQARFSVKQQPCPQCGQVGTLNAHGFLRGYAEQHTDARILRGRRFYCSRRGTRPGCGRTFSIVLSCFISGFMVLVHTLWSFITRVLAGAPLAVAWRGAASGALSRSSGYRLWRRLHLEQTRLRSLLMQACGPPACTHTEPLAHLIAHCEAAFSGTSNPFAALQHRFQQPLFTRSRT